MFNSQNNGNGSESITTPRIALFAEVYTTTPEKARANEAARAAANPLYSASVIKAAPERAKVSAVATGKIKKPRKAKTATPNTKIDVQPTTPAPEAQPTFPPPTITEQAETLSDLTIDERALIENVRKLTPDAGKAIMDIADNFAQPREKAADPLDAVKFVASLSDSEYERFKVALDEEVANVAPAEPTPAQPFANKPIWGEMSVMRYESDAHVMIPRAMQLISLLMDRGLMSFNDRETWGTDWSDGFAEALHIVSHALERVRTDSPMIELFSWGQ